MESHNRVLVVLECALRVLLVNDTLARVLLVVIADLDSIVARVANLLISDYKLAQSIYLRGKFVCSDSKF